jgi:hypothetical protein
MEIVALRTVHEKTPSAVRGQTRPSTESGEAPGWQGETKGA